jgi:DNA polymerase
VVLGAGSKKARVMIVSEAPGDEEDKYGWPFIGQAGDIITQLLHDAGLLARQLDLEEYDDLKKGELPVDTMLDVRRNLFITNMVACRPPDNRDPSAPEMEACWPRLAAQIMAVDPDLIIACGKVAATFLVGRNVAVTEDHGTIFDAKMPGLFRDYTVPTMVILHPAYLMRNADYGPGGPWEGTYKDLEKAREVLDLLGRAHRGADVASRDPREAGGA